MRHILKYPAFYIAAAITLSSAGVGAGAVAEEAPASPGERKQYAQTAAPRGTGGLPEVVITDKDLVLGRNDAPVTIVEYASLTCPHCAAFHAGTLPTLKKEYIDSGKVRLVYRDFPLNRLALTGSVLARCGGPSKFFGFIELLFTRQATWATSRDPLEELEKIARLGGLSKDQFQYCLKDKKLIDAVLQQRLDGNQKFSVESTPTVIINGRKYSGGLSIEEIRLIVDPLLPKS